MHKKKSCRDRDWTPPPPSGISNGPPLSKIWKNSKRLLDIVLKVISNKKIKKFIAISFWFVAMKLLFVSKNHFANIRMNSLNKTAKYGWNRVFVGGKWKKCIIFIENNDNPYENYNNHIKLSIVSQPMIIFLGNKKI